MKKQYLIGLLGLTIIFTPVANSLLSTNSKLFNSTYTNNQIQEESIINEENSQVIVKDLDNDGKASQGDQIDEIQFSANYDEFYPLYEDKSKTTSSNEYGLNIYPENSPNTVKPFYSISYNQIDELNQNQNVDFLNFDFNSTNNPTWKIWDAKLPDSSQEFIITAESKKDNHQEKIIENNIGEVSITPYIKDENDWSEPKVYDAKVTENPTGAFMNPQATISYEVDYGNNGGDRGGKKYQLTKLEIININGTEIKNGTKYADKANQGSIGDDDWLIILTPNTYYDLYMKAIFHDPDDKNAEGITQTVKFDDDSGKFDTFDDKDPDPTPPIPTPPIPTPPGPSSSNTMIMIGIIIGVILFVGIISFIGYYLYKKNK